MNFFKAKEKHYEEIYQNKQIKFSFVNKKGDDYHEIFSPVLCRDFLNDVLVAEETGEEFSIYKFKYDPTVSKIDRDKLRMAVYINKADFNNVVKNLHILNEIESKNKLKPTKFYGLEEGIFLLEADKFWLKSTFLLSFYTLMIRVLSYELKDNWIASITSVWTNESKYVNAIKDNLPVFLSSFKKVFKGKLKSVHGYDKLSHRDLHNNTGIVSLLNKDLVNINYIKNNIYRKAFLNEN